MSDTETPMIALDDADLASLKRYAEVQLGLEVKFGTNAAQIRAKIKTAAPNTVSIPFLGEEIQPTPVPVAKPAADQTVVRYDLYNASLDPKVTIFIDKTSDLSRARDVTVQVNEMTWRMQRGVNVEVPYRVYLALNDAIEKRAVFTGEMNSFGMPEYEYQEEHSYPFRVISMPPQSEIDRWHRETSGAELKAA